MKKKLVIIESPAKAKSLRSYLGEDYEIIATFGHIRDLPTQRLAVDVENGFKPTYSIPVSARKTVANLKKKAKKYKTIMLAADPDREGEAICWHVSRILDDGNKEFKRLRFNAVTRSVIEQAVQHPGTIDMDLVDAQQARRVMDRLVGYRISSFLRRNSCGGQSAGRVQTAALRIVQQRENAIQNFIPKEYWKITSEFGQDDVKFTAELVKIKGKQVCRPDKPPANEEETKAVITALSDTAREFTVTGLATSISKRQPPPPFITSSLQQSASNKLSYPPSRTMNYAQKLYEGFEIDGELTGLITYMRTDSVRMSPEAVTACRRHLESVFGSDTVSDKPRRYRSSKGSQDAHECIRPTDINLTPDSLSGIITKEQLSLYTLIWKRFAATQMKDAEVQKTVVTVTSDEYEFTSEGEKLVASGFALLDPYFVKVKSELPVINKGSVIMLDLKSMQNFTKPPARFKEAMLVAEMKKLGIGRPSTYVSTIATLKKRSYVEKEGKHLYPTKLGMQTADILIELFPHLFELSFTASVEELLDEIADGSRTYVDVLQNIYDPLLASLEMAAVDIEVIKKKMVEELDETCPECGADLIIKYGKTGEFISCTAFPKCRYTRSVKPEEVVDRNCPSCGSQLRIKSGKNGRFLGCSAYPDCRHTEPVPIGMPCPEENCKGELVEKRNRKKRIFYGCNLYPECKFSTWNVPIDTECPRCGFPILEKRKTGIFCPRCKKQIKNS